MSDNPSQPAQNMVLQKAGVIQPALLALRNTNIALSIALRNLHSSDVKAPPELPGVLFHYDFQISPAEEATLRMTLENWYLAKAFQEITRGISASLEEAYLYVQILPDVGKSFKASEFNTIVQEHRRVANRLNFPDLLSRVSSKLTEPLHFASQYLSMIKARNCLEHRAGIVGRDDLNSDGHLTMSFPYMKFFFQRGDQEVEIEKNHVMDEPRMISMRRTIHEIRFGFGDQMTFSARDFGRISSACWLFTQDLEKRLPNLSASA